MRVWIVTVGEPLPEKGAKDRLHRSGILAQYLVEQGHEVVWWGSAFDHFTKRHHYSTDTQIQVSDRFKMVLFHGDGYRRNVSFARMKDHRQVATKFAAAIEKEAHKPDVILTSFPTIELSAVSVRYGKRHGIPVVLDIRDLWPDIFLDAAPKAMGGLVRLALRSLFRQTEEAFEGCTGMIGISPGYIGWGLRYAGRDRKPSDALFPLGYKKPNVAAPLLEQAKSQLVGKGVDPARPIAWFVGTFGRTYDLAPVVETARRFAGQGRSDVQFVLSGSGEKEPAIREQAEGLSNVVLTGWVDAPQIAYLMRVARVGLAAYAAGAPQGLPNKFFEYLSAGLPILSSLEGEAAELLATHGCGVSYRAGDATDLASKLTKLLDDPHALREMASRGKALFDQAYSADVVYPQFVRYLEGTASKYGSATSIN